MKQIIVLVGGIFLGTIGTVIYYNSAQEELNEQAIGVNNTVDAQAEVDRIRNKITVLLESVEELKLQEEVEDTIEIKLKLIEIK